MKNSRYYPFERNRYFYGKLLTVRDFESEQKYFNDKRRLLNRLLYGSGVVSGLQVVAVDDKAISVEMGLALDNMGREIVIPSPVTLKLSAIEGFTNNEYGKNVYLCIAFDEKGKEPVHSIANSTVRSEEVSEYNRVLESYKLFIKEEAPDPFTFEYAKILEDTCVIYNENQVRILQKTPRYVNPGQIFEMTIIVEKSLQTAKVSFEYEIQSDQFTPVEQMSTSFISFAEPNESQETEYEIKIALIAGNTLNTQGKITIKQGSSKINIGEKQSIIEASTTNTIEIIKDAVKNKIVGSYFDRTLDKSLESTSDQCIYLAKISLLQRGPTYIIEHVQGVPFGEYVYNASMLYKLGMITSKSTEANFLAKSSISELNANEKPQLKVDYDQENNMFDFKLALPQIVSNSNEVAMGVVELSLKPNVKSGLNPFNKLEKSIFSDEINHGLGAGHTFVVVGLEDMNDNHISDMLNSGNGIYFGDADVFKDSQYDSEIPNVSIGTLVYPQKGTFRIGIKPNNAVEGAKIRVRWWAYKTLPGNAAGTNLSAIEAAAAKNGR